VLAEDTDNGTNTVTLRAPASIASNFELRLPTADGTSGQAIVTDGSGNLSFGTAGITTGKSIAMAMIFGF
jgi:glycine cleavage system aminomethyltransferase T